MVPANPQIPPELQELAGFSQNLAFLRAGAGAGRGPGGRLPACGRRSQAFYPPDITILLLPAVNLRSQSVVERGLRSL
jgi:hypothetical protein